MPTLEFPNNIASNFYYAFHQEATTMDTSYFPMNTMEGTNITSVVFNSPEDFPYRYLKYIDLDQSLEGESTPFFDTMQPFTIDLTMDIDVMDADTYFDKSRVFFSIGQPIAGKTGGVITVGTNAEDTANKRRPVVGFLNENMTVKAPPINTSIELDSSGTYSFKLVFNPQTEGNNRLILFMKKGANSFATQSHGYGLSVNFNYHITKPRLYLNSSGWTNEYGWNNTYDYAYGSLTDRSLKVTNGVVYSQEFLLDSLSSVVFEQPEMNQPDGINADSEVASSDTNLEIYL